MRTKRSFTRSLAGVSVAGLLACVAANAFADELLVPAEGFETDGEGVRYTSNTWDSRPTAGIGWFARESTNPPAGFLLTLLNVQGSSFWASEDVKGPGFGGTVGPGVPGIVRLNDLSVSGYSNLQVHLYLATGRTDARPENNDFLQVQYAMDGNSGGTNLALGTYSTIGQFVGDNPGAGLAGLMRQDTNLNGQSYDAADAGSPVLTETFTEYTFNIPVTGSTLSVQVRLDQLGGSEEYAFDSIRITGDLSANVAPVLANLEVGNLSYTEEDPATQVTNTITVSDSDDTNIESATIQITAGNDPTEDVLAIVGAPAGITVGAYVPATGTLPLTGTASLADYQAALRLVTYVNSDLNDPSLQTRTVTFSVNDGDTGSNFVSRDIDITPDVLTGTIPHKESFETAGEGERYNSSNFNAGGSTGIFERVDTAAPPSQFFTALTGQDGSWWFATEQTSNAANPLSPDTKGYIKLHDLTASGFTGLEVTVNLAVSRFGEARWEDDDYVEVQYAFDGDIGATEDAGAYTTIGRFIGGNGILGDELTQDADLDGLADVAGAQPTAAFTPFTFSIPATGNLLSVRVVVESDGSEELGIDCIEVTGLVGPPLGPAPAAENGFIRLRNVRGAKTGTLIVAASLDFGDGTVDLSQAATLSFGSQSIALAAGDMTERPAGTWSWKSADRKRRLIIREPRGDMSSGILSFRKVGNSDTLGGTDDFHFEYVNGAFDVVADVDVGPLGKYSAGKAPATNAPVAVVSINANIPPGADNDDFTLVAEFASDMMIPATAPDIVIRIGEPGNAFEMLVPFGLSTSSTWAGKGYRYRVPDPDGTGPLKPPGLWYVTIDYTKRQIRAFGHNVELGSFGAIPGSAPIYVSVGIDGTEHAVQVQGATQNTTAGDRIQYR